MLRNDDFSKFLSQQNILDDEQIRIGLREAAREDLRLDHALVRLGFITEDQILPCLARFLNVAYEKISDKSIDREVISRVPVKYAHHFQFLPIAQQNGALQIAINEPCNPELIDEIQLVLQCRVRAALSGQKDIREALRKYYGVGADTVEKLMEDQDASHVLDVPAMQTEKISEADSKEDASIIKFVNQILLEAYKDRATDIHIEPYEEDLRIRYRVDGILHQISMPPSIRQLQSSIVSRIKIMANLDIAERRLPQDGRIKLKISDEELDLRVSLLPTPFGESVNIRMLSSRMTLLDLENLGLMAKDQEILERIIRKPHGIIFVTGPTGSGKTTTLYACLSKLNHEERKIITVEDPIEYIIRGITQIQVHPKIDLTFARALRSMLRHDPNVMMVGEVRDYETAEITIRVALTGHLVFSTLHTNDAAGAVTRLIDMGIEPYLVASSLECVLAQRLVRLICKDCKIQVPIRAADAIRLGLNEMDQKIPVYDGNGCEACKFSGYKGRTAIYEILTIDDDMRELIVQKKPAHELKAHAVSKGMRSLRQDGWEKIKSAVTSVSEVLRVSQDAVES